MTLQSDDEKPRGRDVFAETVAALPESTRELLLAIFDFQEQRGIPSLQLAGDLKRLAAMFEQIHLAARENG